MRQTAIRRFRSGRPWRAAALVLLTALGTLLPGTRPAAALPDAGELSSQQVFDRSQPGVHRIVVEHTARVSAPDPALDADRLMAQVTRMLSEQGPTGRQQTVDLMVREIQRDPLTYFRPVPGGYSAPVTLTRTGSGFTVSPDGHIVTSAHVVAPDPGEIEAAMAGRVILEIRAALTGETTALAGPGQPVTAAQRQLLAEATEQFVAHHLEVGPIQTTITVAPPAGSPEPQQPREADLVAAGDQVPGKDVAVVEVDGATGMPAIPLGDDTAVSIGDRLYVLGYPAPATLNPLLPEERQTEPTLTAGLLSARRTMDAGFTVLQTDAAMTGGGSGRPVLDARGKVVGVATSGSVEPDAGEPAAGTGFIMPVSAIRDLLQRAGVTPAMDAATRTHNQADETPREVLGASAETFTVPGVAVVVLLAALAAARRWRPRRRSARHARGLHPGHQAGTGHAPPPPPGGRTRLRGPEPAWPAPTVRPDTSIRSLEVYEPVVKLRPAGWVREGPPRAATDAAGFEPAVRCGHCGARSRPTARFCTTCGNRGR